MKWDIYFFSWKKQKLFFLRISYASAGWRAQNSFFSCSFQFSPTEFNGEVSSRNKGRRNWENGRAEKLVIFVMSPSTTVAETDFAINMKKLRCPVANVSPEGNFQYPTCKTCQPSFFTFFLAKYQTERGPIFGKCFLRSGQTDWLSNSVIWCAQTDRSDQGPEGRNISNKKWERGKGERKIEWLKIRSKGPSILTERNGIIFIANGLFFPSILLLRRKWNFLFVSKRGSKKNVDNFRTVLAFLRINKVRNMPEAGMRFIFEVRANTQIRSTVRRDPKLWPIPNFGYATWSNAEKKDAKVKKKTSKKRGKRI